MRFKTISTKIINKNPWCEYKKDEFIKENGEKGEYFYVKGPGSAIVIPILDDGRLILVSQYRYLKDKLSTEFPCGGCVEGLSVNENAQKEFLEETGYKTGELLKVGEFEGLNGLAKEDTHVFIATDLEKIKEPEPEVNGEVLETIYRRPDEFEEMVKRGEIWDGQTLAAWALSREHVYKIVNQ